MCSRLFMNTALDKQGEFLLYQTEAAGTRVQVRLQGNTLWLTQKQIAELFEKDVRTISEHLKNIYEEGELDQDSTIRKFRIVALEGSRNVERLADHYNLDVILHVGYRVRSPRGTQFRRWATEQLKTYLTQGFLLDDERFKRGQDEGYFENLLARIRDIRSSEKVFWKKVLNIYATSIDYDPSLEASKQFFATIQNKMHWAVHGHTAAEIIALRADATAKDMGLTNWEGVSSGGAIRKQDVRVAKNYLKEDELILLNRMVTAYLEFAELQAHNRKTMTMSAWVAKLDDFLKLSEREILTHAGKVSHEVAEAKAEAEFLEYRVSQFNLPNAVERDFEKALQESVKGLERKRKT